MFFTKITDLNAQQTNKNNIITRDPYNAATAKRPALPVVRVASRSRCYQIASLDRIALLGNFVRDE